MLPNPYTKQGLRSLSQTLNLSLKPLNCLLIVSTSRNFCLMKYGASVLCQVAEQTSVAFGRYLCDSDAAIRAVNKQTSSTDVMSPARLFLCSSARSACSTAPRVSRMTDNGRCIMQSVCLWESLFPRYGTNRRDTPVTPLRDVSILFELHRLNSELIDRCRLSLFVRPK